MKVFYFPLGKSPLRQLLIPFSQEELPYTTGSNERLNLDNSEFTSKL
jgi:hypothetical protein